ncbi:AraC family transcriptional regulator [Spirosoma validum]|uniref:AraC family transcriptional regulator n=1 Tax=Spirosoma validum TaxID=2771355 RepID=A0A927B720_9BACT|nr:AraC family transcriptional regulator [Spirosoma validum]MBD2756391.1 AraC family transcriptional regulator [Spirosoma validum]
MNDFQLLFVSNLLGYATQRNLSPERLCTLSGIDLEAFKQQTSVVITPKQLNDLWLNASHLSNDPLFGLHFGESMQLAALGVVGQIIQTSKTVGEALTHAADFIQLLTNLFDMDVSRTDRTFSVQFIPHPDRAAESPFALRQMLDLSMAFVLHEVDGLVLKRIKPDVVTLAYDTADTPEYERVLRCRPIEKTDANSLVFDGQYWDEPILTANHELQQILLQKASALLNTFGTGQLLNERILNYLIANAYLGMPTLEEIAANFNTSSRSLQRKLQEEGVTYQQLADSIRKSLAVTYLESGRYPIKEISYLLGYNELSAFSRAFKRWTGSTPVTYQKR